jgi:hypothetical protein
VRNPLTSALLAEQLKRMAAVFPSKLSSQNPAYTAEVYKDGLRGIDGDALVGAVDLCIQTDSYFPKVARLREAAGEWMKRNRAHFAPVIKPAWNVCGVCGAKAESPAITRPKKYDAATDAPYFLTAKEYRMPNGSTLPVGQRIPAGKLLGALARGIVLETETIPNPRTVITHDPAMHHVRKGEEGEFEGAA